jgi:hypothetical protein
VGRDEGAGGLAHAHAAGIIRGERARRLDRFPRVRNAQRRAFRDRARRRLLEVEGRGPDDDGLAQRARLDQVLAAVGEEAPSHDDQVARGIVGRHFSHGVSDDDASRGRNLRLQAAALAREAQAQREVPDLVEALRVARDDDEQDGRVDRGGRERFEEERFLAVARAGRHPHAARGAEPFAERSAHLDHPGGHGHVELDVPGHGGSLRPEALESAGVGRGLRRDAR